MKKKYVAPASALLTLNFSENIAASSSMESGGDSLSGSGTILFTQYVDDCRGLYTNISPVTLSPSSTWLQYFMEMFGYGLGVVNACLIQ